MPGYAGSSWPIALALASGMLSTAVASVDQERGQGAARRSAPPADHRAGGSAGIRGLLMVRSEEPAGDRCARGGTRITVGIDQDSDGRLSPGETSETASVCRFDQRTLLASSFGARGDGTTDDTAALQRAIDSTLARGGRLQLGAGKTYLISRGLNFVGGSRFELDGQGATIRMAGGAPVSWGYFMLHFARCADFTARDLTLDARRGQRAPREVDAHSVMLVSSRRFTFLGVHSNNAVTDGYYLSAGDPADPDTYCSDGAFVDCSADLGFRQGMSIINARRIKILGGDYSRTSGTPPQAGIDVESNAGSAMPGNSGIVIMGATFTGNAGRGISLGPEVERPEDVTISHCRFAANAGGGISSAGSRVRILDNLFEDFTSSEVGVVRLSTKARESVVRGNTFRRIHMSTPVEHGVVEVNYGVDNAVRDNTFEDVDRVAIRVRGSGNVVENNRVDGRQARYARCETRLYGSFPDCYR